MCGITRVKKPEVDWQRLYYVLATHVKCAQVADACGNRDKAFGCLQTALEQITIFEDFISEFSICSAGTPLEP